MQLQSKEFLENIEAYHGQVEEKEMSNLLLLCQVG